MRRRQQPPNWQPITCSELIAAIEAAGLADAAPGSHELGRLLAGWQLDALDLINARAAVGVGLGDRLRPGDPVRPDVAGVS